MTNDNPLQGAVNWIAKAIPEPSKKDMATQIAVHIEEFKEFLEILSSQDDEIAENILDALDNLELLSSSIKRTGAVCLGDRAMALDALCDSIQTAAAVAHTNGMDLVGGMTEVVESNFSKFVDGEPLFNENRKIQKGPDYFKPDLKKFI